MYIKTKLLFLLLFSFTILSFASSVLAVARFSDCSTTYGTLVCGDGEYYCGGCKNGITYNEITNAELNCANCAWTCSIAGQVLCSGICQTPNTSQNCSALYHRSTDPCTGNCLACESGYTSSNASGNTACTAIPDPYIFANPSSPQAAYMNITGTSTVGSLYVSGGGYFGGNASVHGKFGIGASSLTELLEVSDSSDNGQVARFRLTDSSGTQNPEIQLQYSNWSESPNNHWAINADPTGGNAANFNIWGPNVGTYPTGGYALTIRSDGNFGIGVIDPSEKLSIAGNIKAGARANFYYGDNSHYGYVGGYTQGDELGWQLGYGKTDISPKIVDFVVGSSTTDPYTNLRIFYGHVGIGTKEIPGAELDVQGQAMFGGIHKQSPTANYELETLGANQNLLYGVISSASAANSNLLMLQNQYINKLVVSKDGGLSAADFVSSTKFCLNNACITDWSASGGGSGSGYWGLNGNNLFASSTSYNVGIGTISPSTTARLEVVGRVSSTELVVSTQILSNALYGRGYTAGNPGASENIWLGDSNDTIQVQGSINVGVGGAYKYNGVNLAYASTTKNNYFFGVAGNSTMTGYANTGLGSGALTNNASGIGNTATGQGSLQSNTLGNNNTANGSAALLANVSGNYNVAVGNRALQALNSGDYNIAVGNFSGHNPNLGSNRSSVSDSKMTFIGAYASRGDTVTFPISNGTAIGYNAQVGGSNMMALGGLGTDAVKVGIGISTPNSRLHVYQDDGNNAEIDIQSSAGNYWAIYHDRASSTLKFWNGLGVTGSNALELKGGATEAATQVTVKGDLCLGGVCKSTWASNSVFKGLSIANYSSSIVGYFAANDACNNSFSGAHVCSSQEIFNSMNDATAKALLISTTGEYWISNGMSEGAYSTNDCEGWTSTAVANYGAVWVFAINGGKSGLRTCNNATRKFACCK